jgi:hypothetical protein
MSKRPSFGNHFEKLKALGSKRPLDERKPPLETPKTAHAGEGGLTRLSSILEESLSRVNTVDSEQSPALTEVGSPTVQAEQSEPSSLPRMDTVLAYSDPVAVSVNDAVQDEVCEKRTVSKSNTGPNEQTATKSRVAGGFTAVPHSLLRGEAKFRDPIDFMVYMHLFTYSHGFNRQTADMSQSQLERFSGVAKNTIKRSLDRLAKDGWIKMVEDYESARMSRKWRVFTPEERRGGPKGGKKSTGSSADPDLGEQGPTQTVDLSNLDAQTVSRVDPYIDITYPASHLPEVTCE